MTVEDGATSTWMEDEVFPEVKDYLNYLGLRYDDSNDNGRWDLGETYYNIDGSVAGVAGRTSKWFDKPEVSLDTYEGGYGYGSVVWVKYLSENYGKTMIRDIWNRIGDGQSALRAIFDECLAQQLSFSSLMKDFRERVLFRSFADGRYYPMVKHEGSFVSYPQSITEVVDHLTCRYYVFKADDSKGSLKLSFLNVDAGGLAVRLILHLTRGGYDEQDVPTDSSRVTLKIEGFGASERHSKVTVIVMNNFTTQNGGFYSFNATREVACGSGSSDDGGPCFIATAAYGSYLAPEVMVLRWFRDRYMLTNPLGRGLVRYYYQTSPALAGHIAKHELLRTMTKYALTPLVFGIRYSTITWLLAAMVIVLGVRIMRKSP